MGPDGTAHALWTHHTYQLRARDAAAGRRWGALQPVANAGGIVYSNSAAVGVDGRGRVTAAWDEEAGTHYHVKAAIRTAGGHWGHPTMLGRGADTDESAWNLNVAVGRAGHTVFSWLEIERDRARAAYRPRGEKWARPVTLPTAASTCCPQVQAAVDGRGVATFVYGHGHHLILRQRTPQGWRHAVDLTSNLIRSDTCYPSCFDVAAARPGVFDVVWTSRDNALHVGRYDRGVWTENATLLKPAGSPRVGKVAVDATRDGAAYTWLSTLPGTLYASYQVTGADPGPAATLARRVWSAQVAHDSTGVMLAYEVKSRHLYVSRHDNGTPADAWSTPVEASVTRTRDAGSFALAASPSSPTTTLVWESPAASEFKILARSVTAADAAR